MSVEALFTILLILGLIVGSAMTIAGIKHLANLYYESQTISLREHQFSLLVLGIIFIAFVAAMGMLAGFVLGA